MKWFVGLAALAALAMAQISIASGQAAPEPDATGAGETAISLSFSPVAANNTYNPSTQINFTAAVISGTGGPTPTGTVTFTDESTGGQLPGSPVMLDGTGTATLDVTSGMQVGGNNIVASYSGDANYAANTSQTVVITLEKSTTTLTVTPASNTPQAGTSLAVTVTIAAGTPPAGDVAPTGAVTLNVDGTAAGTRALSTSGDETSASFTVNFATSGTHQLQAVYAGDDNYEASTSTSVSVTVAKMPSVTTLTAAPSTLMIGVPEALTAVVNAGSGVSTSTAPTGTVSFYDGATLLGTQTVTSYSATLNNVMLDTTKSHLITAVYSGDTNFAASTSNALSLAAALLPDTVTLTANPTAAGPGQAVNFVATVTPNSAPAATYEQNPTGKVTFYNGTTVVGTATLVTSIGNSSTASLTLATLPAGASTITAVYAGDSYFAPGTSNAVPVTVEDFVLTPSPSNPPTGLTIVKGKSGLASFLVSSAGGFDGQVEVTCNVPAGVYITCTPSPVTVTPTAAITYTVQTYSTGSLSTAVSRRDNRLRAVSGVALALAVFLAPLGWRRRSWTRFGALILLLAGLCGAGMGCNGSSSSTTSTGNGTPLGATTLTITATAYVDNAVVSHSIYLNVNVVQ